jgi:outer membrane lipoprotein
LIGGCATTPALDDSGVDHTIVPATVIDSAGATRGRLVLWGGQIVTSRNLAKTTELEVVSYPLDKEQRPEVGAQTGERFIIVRQGYLETVDYAAGRLVTVVGKVLGTREGMVGEKKYTYAVIEARALHLWPSESVYGRDTQFNFGIGVGFGFGN